VIPSLLIVEDEAILAEAMHDYLARRGYEPRVAGSGEDACAQMRESEVDLVILDYRLPGMDGVETLRELKKLAPTIAVIMLTAHGTLRIAVDAMRAGAYDYLSKPVDLEELALVLDRAWNQVKLEREIRYWRETGRQGDPRARIVGDSAATRALRGQVERLAALDQGPDGAPPILITGETGTGKGLIARTIHDLGPRAGRPFVELNCGAIPGTLLESEIFGYERGAFTDARAAKPGLFEAADGGTLFLDEIGAMPLELQVKLLKVIDEKSVRRLGAVRSRRIDARVVAATNANLDDAARRGQFRPDLLYRLKVLTLALPPLRDRPEDVGPLAAHYLAEFGRRYRRPRRFHPAAAARLLDYAWPGNVRELANVVERAVLLQEGDEILPVDLGLEVPAASADGAVKVAAGAVRVDLSRGGVSFAEVERALLVEALRVGGNRRRAAELLDLSLDTLRYRVEKHGLTVSPDRDAPGA
jgi:DNA-binding NtrC family response regulator